jgi:hypothetical protein
MKKLIIMAALALPVSLMAQSDPCTGKYERLVKRDSLVSYPCPMVVMNLERFTEYFMMNGNLNKLQALTASLEWQLDSLERNIYSLHQTYGEQLAIADQQLEVKDKMMSAYKTEHKKLKRERNISIGLNGTLLLLALLIAL